MPKIHIFAGEKKKICYLSLRITDLFKAFLPIADIMEETQDEYFTIFGPSLDDPIKCRTMADVTDWFYWNGPYEINPDPDDPDTWDFNSGWFIEYNDGSHMDPEDWDQLEVYARTETDTPTLSGQQNPQP